MCLSNTFNKVINVIRDIGLSYENLVREGEINGEIQDNLPFIFYVYDPRTDVDMFAAKILFVDDDVVFKIYKSDDCEIFIPDNFETNNIDGFCQLRTFDQFELFFIQNDHGSIQL
jgi:hypothetical protein